MGLPKAVGGVSLITILAPEWFEAEPTEMSPALLIRIRSVGELFKTELNVNATSLPAFVEKSAFSLIAVILAVAPRVSGPSARPAVCVVVSELSVL